MNPHWSMYPAPINFVHDRRMMLYPPLRRQPQQMRFAPAAPRPRPQHRSPTDTINVRNGTYLRNNRPYLDDRREEIYLFPPYAKSVWMRIGSRGHWTRYKIPEMTVSALKDRLRDGRHGVHVRLWLGYKYLVRGRGEVRYVCDMDDNRKRVIESYLQGDAEYVITVLGL